MHMIHKPLAWPPVTVWPETHLCFVSGALMELTPLSPILLWLRGVVLSLQLWQIVLGHPKLAFLCSIVWGRLSLASDLQIQNLASSV